MKILYHINYILSTLRKLSRFELSIILLMLDKNMLYFYK